MNPLFPVVDGDLASLTDTELTDLLASFQAVSRQLKNGEIDLNAHYGAEGDHTAKMMGEWREAAGTVREIKAELATREERDAGFAEVANEIHSEFEDEDEAELAVASEDDDDSAGDDEEKDKDEEDKDELAAEVADPPESDEAADEPAGDEEKDALSASSPPVVRYPATPKSRKVDEERTAMAQLVASIGTDTIRAGDVLDSNSYARLVVERARRLKNPQHVKGGAREFHTLANVDFPFPDELTLRANDPEGNAAKIAAIGNPYLGAEARAALAASGGICAPPTPFYDLPQLSTTGRPVRDGLPSFRSERGGVLVPSVSTLADADGSVTVIEAEDDAAGGSAATKSCLAMECAEWTPVFIGAIAHCREVGNFNARTWPEGIEHENGNTMALWARTAEGRLLDRIDGYSLNLSRAAVYGAASTLLYALQISRVGIISRLRMDRNSRFRVILPFYAAEMFSLDLVNSQFGRFDTPPEQVGALLSRYGFNVIWHEDEGIDPAAAAEVWPLETDDSVQEDWPGSTIIARVFPEGQFVHLDGGTLELGLVRDSELNHQNDFELFGESFESLFSVGPTQAAHRLAITVCPDGTVAAPAEAITCSAT